MTEEDGTSSNKPYRVGIEYKMKQLEKTKGTKKNATRVDKRDKDRLDKGLGRAPSIKLESRVSKNNLGIRL